MKRFRYIIYMFAGLAAMTAVSCVEENLEEAGEYDLENCYGVYFPSQENSGDIEVAVSENPEKDYSLTFTVKRLKSEGAITVPVESSIVNEQGESADSLFSLSGLAFDDGQKESSFTLSFPEAEIGAQYEISFVISDPEYASLYSEYQASMECSLIIINWVLLEDTSADKSCPGKWRDDIISSLFSVTSPNAENDDIIVYEREDKPGYYRFENVYSAQFVYDLGLFTGVSDPSDLEGNITDVSIIVDATDSNNVYIPQQDIGVYLGSGYGEMYVASLLSDYFTSVTTSLYGTMSNGVIEFPAESLVSKMDEYDDGWYTVNASGLQRIILPGYSTSDYDMTLVAGTSESGILPVSYTFGADMAYAKYAIVSGSLTDIGAENEADEIAASSVDNSTIYELTETEGTISVSLSETGVYTLVSANYDSSNEYVGCSYVNFSYIAAGDDMPVVISAELTATDKYQSQGYTSENSLEYFVYGSDIEEAYIGLFPGDLSGYTDEYLSSMMEYYASYGYYIVSDDELDEINGDGHGGISTGLAPGSAYTMVIYASNGYKYDVKTVVATTGGEYSEKYDSFTSSDLYTAADAADFCGTWNYYAYDYLAGDETRSYIGQVTATSVVQQGYTYVVMDGLLGPAADELGMSDKTMYFLYNRGVLYSLYSMYDPIEYYKGLTMYPVTGFWEPNYAGSIINDYSLIGGMTSDGNIAFVDSGYYSNYGYEITGISLLLYQSSSYTGVSSSAAIYDEPILMNPDNDTVPESGTSASSPASEFSTAARTLPANSVETPEGWMQSVIDKMNSDKKTPKNRFAPADNVKVAHNAVRVQFSAVSAPGKASLPASGYGEVRLRENVKSMKRF